MWGICRMGLQSKANRQRSHSLAERGHFFNVNPEAIADKSKADILTKSLIVLQVSWIIVQCIARKTNGYSLSLLEIHTMVHVLCVLVICVLWWEVYYSQRLSEFYDPTFKRQKPLDIIEPTIIHRSQIEECSGTIALMPMEKDLRPMDGREPLLGQGPHVCNYNQI